MADIKELIATYDEYIELLTASEAGLFGLAYAHGYRSPAEKVKRGTELRQKIKNLKADLKQ